VAWKTVSSWDVYALTSPPWCGRGGDEIGIARTSVSALKVAQNGLSSLVLLLERNYGMTLIHDAHRDAPIAAPAVSDKGLFSARELIQRSMWSATLWASAPGYQAVLIVGVST